LSFYFLPPLLYLEKSENQDFSASSLNSAQTLSDLEFLEVRIHLEILSLSPFSKSVSMGGLSSLPQKIRKLVFLLLVKVE